MRTTHRYCAMRECFVHLDALGGVTLVRLCFRGSVACPPIRFHETRAGGPTRRSTPSTALRAAYQAALSTRAHSPAPLPLYASMFGTLARLSALSIHLGGSWEASVRIDEAMHRRVTRPRAEDILLPVAVALGRLERPVMLDIGTRGRSCCRLDTYGEVVGRLVGLIGGARSGSAARL
jgi:hypothetical protein